MEEVKKIALGSGSGEAGIMTMLMDPGSLEGDEEAKEIQAATIEIYGNGPFEIEETLRDTMKGEGHLVRLNILRNRSIVMPAKSLAEIT